MRMLANKPANVSDICINVKDVWVFASQELWKLSIRPSLIHSIGSFLSTDISVNPQPTAFTGLSMLWVALEDTVCLFYYNLFSAVGVKGMCKGKAYLSPRWTKKHHVFVKTYKTEEEWKMQILFSKLPWTRICSVELWLIFQKWLKKSPAVNVVKTIGYLV